MPIFDQGYQHWQGALSGHAWRWLTITRRGVRVQLRGRLTRIALLLALVPALALGGFLIIWGLIEQKSSLVMPLMQMFRDLPEELRAGPRNFRVSVWTIAYDYYFRFNVFYSMILIFLIGPGLISKDLRFNAIPLYFSRPLRRWDYFVGKLGVIGVFIAAVVIVPALVAYLLGICFSLDMSVFRDTWRLLVGSVVYGSIVVISAGMLMLAMSSLSRNSRYVAIMWAGIWFISNVVADVLTHTIRSARWCPLISYTANLKRLGLALLDTESAWNQFGSFFGPRDRERILSQLVGPTHPWYWSAGVLLALFGISVWILSLRVKSLDRLK